MKVIIAGGRDIFRTISQIQDIMLESGFYDSISEEVCGGAIGIDDCGQRWANSRGIPVKTFKADWESHGKSAGPIRNREMAEYGDALVLIWDGKSRGSSNMLHEAQKRGLKVHQHLVKS